MTDLYVSRSQHVEAIQWDGHVSRATAIVEWAGADKVALGDDYGLRLLAGKDGAQEWVPVPVGHWLVRQPGDVSDIWPVDPDYFAAKYQPADPQPDTAPEGRWVIDDDELIWEDENGSLDLRDLNAPHAPYNSAVAARAALVDLVRRAPATPADRAVIDAAEDWYVDQRTGDSMALAARVAKLLAERNQNDG